MKQHQITLTISQAQALHTACYLRLRELAMVEDHNPDALRRAHAIEEGNQIVPIADQLAAIIGNAPDQGEP